MIVLDTNVLSEMIRPHPALNVKAALASFAESELRVTTISACELLYGVAIMSSGRRRTELEISVHTILSHFASRTLAFDTTAVPHYVAIAVRHRQLGLILPILDAQIAAIALAHGANVVTRNQKGFRHFQVPIINPWEEAL